MICSSQFNYFTDQQVSVWRQGPISGMRARASVTVLSHQVRRLRKKLHPLLNNPQTNPCVLMHFLFSALRHLRGGLSVVCLPRHQKEDAAHSQVGQQHEEPNSRGEGIQEGEVAGPPSLQDAHRRTQANTNNRRLRVKSIKAQIECAMLWCNINVTQDKTTWLDFFSPPPALKVRGEDELIKNHTSKASPTFTSAQRGPRIIRGEKRWLSERLCEAWFSLVAACVIREGWTKKKEKETGTANKGSSDVINGADFPAPHW